MMTSRSLSFLSASRAALLATGLIAAVALPGIVCPGPALADTQDDIAAMRRQIADLEVRLSVMEDQLRQQTGSVQNIGHRVDQVEQKLKSLNDDVEFRLERLEQAAGVMAGGSMTPASKPSTTPGKLAKTTSTPTSNKATSSKPAGTPTSTEPPRPSSAQSSRSSRAAYNAALSLLRRGDYDTAEQSLKAFMRQYPKDKLTGNAQYWLGETYYVRGQYDKAAKTFLSNVKTYSKGGKGPDSFLKLGMSLVQLGQKKKGCQVLADVPNRYAHASATIKQRAEREHKNAGCS